MLASSVLELLAMAEDTSNSINLVIGQLVLSSPSFFLHQFFDDCQLPCDSRSIIVY